MARVEPVRCKCGAVKINAVAGSVCIEACKKGGISPMLTTAQHNAAVREWRTSDLPIASLLFNKKHDVDASASYVGIFMLVEKKTGEVINGLFRRVPVTSSNATRVAEADHKRALLDGESREFVRDKSVESMIAVCFTNGEATDGDEAEDKPDE